MAEDRHPGADDFPEQDPDRGDANPGSPGESDPRAGGPGQGEPGSGGSEPGGSGPGEPGAGGSGPASRPQNPFEALFGQLGALGGQAGLGGQGGQGGANVPDLNALMSQLQSAFASFGGGGMFGTGQGASESGVNWDLTKDTARKTVASLGPDPSPDSGRQRAVADAVSIAEVWLDDSTDFPRVGGYAAAWSRAEWIEKTMPVWQRLVTPVASHIADAMEGALSFNLGDGPEGGPEGSPFAGMAGMEQMLRPMLRTSGASMFGLQLGQGRGRLAAEVVGATDIGLPLTENDQVALLPANVQQFGEGLDQSATDVTLYLALRECARQRLFSSASWLRSQLLNLVEEYARGITIDTSALEQAVNDVDPNNLEELSRTLEGGLFEPQKTPEQEATLTRLETMLALVEGWVDEVVGQATVKWMPAAGALAETVRRRRAAGGPAEATFATLVGLELRPRRMRDAANLWAAVRDARGPSGRDAVWSHPDLIPTSADLDDPLGFVSGDQAAPEEGDFDAALADLLDAEERQSPESEAPQAGDQALDHGEDNKGEDNKGDTKA